MKSLTGLRDINPRAEAEQNMRFTGVMPLKAPDETRAALATGFALLAVHDTLTEIRDLLKASNWEAQQGNQLLVRLLQQTAAETQKAEVTR